MYTQVTFGQFLDRLLANSGIEFKQYPNPWDDWRQGDWGYEIQHDMAVRIFRYSSRNAETTIPGPRWNDISETCGTFEPRFTAGFNAAVMNLQ